MEEEKDAFYIVRKGDIVGVYKSLRDCQAQAGSSVISLLPCNLILVYPVEFGLQGLLRFGNLFLFFTLDSPIFHSV